MDLGVVNVLAAAMQHGASKKRVAELAALLGTNRRTLVPWRRRCLSTFATSRFMNSLRGRFEPVVDEATMPASLESRMAPTDDDSMMAALLPQLAAAT